MQEAHVFTGLPQSVRTGAHSGLPPPGAGFIGTGAASGGDFRLSLLKALDKERGAVPSSEDEAARLASQAAGEFTAAGLSDKALSSIRGDDITAGKIFLEGMTAFNGETVGGHNYGTFDPDLNAASSANGSGPAGKEEPLPGGIPNPGSPSSRIPEHLRGGLHQIRERMNPEFWSRIRERFHNIMANDIPVQLDFDRLGVDVWVQQVWPLADSHSLFDERKSEVPHKSERNTDRLSEVDRALLEFDRVFEHEWAVAGSSGSDGNESNDDANSTPEAYRLYNRGVESAGFSPLPNGDELFAAMVNRMQLNLERGNYRMSLELHPESLGKVLMKVSLAGDKMHARFIVESEEVRGLMLARIEELKSALKANGVSVDSLEIALMNSTGERTMPSTASTAGGLRSSRGGEVFFDESRAAYFQPGGHVLTDSWVV